MNDRPCAYCHDAPVVGRKRKYCDKHSRQASAIWKREHRRQWKAEGDPYWRVDWKNKTDEERRAYYRTYMRDYRRRRRSPQARPTEKEEATTWTNSA